MEQENWPRRKRLRLESYDYTEAGYYFVTLCTKLRNKDILCSLKAVGGGLCAAPPDPEPVYGTEHIPRPFVELTPIGRVVEAAIRDIPRYNPGVGVDTYCVMLDHVHMIITLPGRHRGRPLHEVIGRMKSYTQTQYGKMGAPWGPKLWQESYYDHIVRNDSDLAETRKYIQTNPAKIKGGSSK